MNTTNQLVGLGARLGEDPADVLTDAHPYLRLALRRLYTASLTPAGVPQPPEVVGVDADPRVPNVLQPMNGEFAGGAEVGDGKPGFFNPAMPPPSGVASTAIMPRGILQRPPERSFGAPTGAPNQNIFDLLGLARWLGPIGNER